MTTTNHEDEGFADRIFMCLPHEIETARKALENIESLLGAMAKQRSQSETDRLLSQEHACRLSLKKMGIRVERTSGEMAERRYQLLAVGAEIDPDGHKMTLSELVEFVKAKREA